MARPTIAALQAELAALRHNNEVLATERDSLRTELAALRAAPVRVAATRPAPSAPSTARRAATVFEFDPSIRGDFMRATKLAREANGIVRRARS